MTFKDRLRLVNEQNLNVMAVDIGEKGGFCANYVDILILTRMPKTPQDRFVALDYPNPDEITAENVHVFPGQGAVSNGRLLQNKGQIEGIAASIGIDVKWIEPMRWIECFTMKRKKHFDNTLKWKKHLLSIAEVLAQDQTTEKLTLYTCDAFLMWNYAASLHTNQPLKPIGPW